MFKYYRPAATLIVAFAAVVICAQAGAALKTLSGHVPVAAASSKPTGRLNADSKLDLSVGLRLREPQALSAFLRELYDPSSTNFHRYLTPEQFTARFGPTAQDYQAVLNFARANGLAVSHAHGNRLLLDVNGKVSDIERAFHITLRTYRHPTEARNFFAPDTEPSVDETLRISDVSGLSDFAKPEPMLHLRPAGGLRTAGGSGPGSGYLGLDFRNAYVPGTALNGFGQEVGLIEFSGYDPNDIFAYEAQAGLPDVPLQNVLLDGYQNTANPNEEGEVCLDIEMAIAMATNLAAVVVFEAPDTGSYFNDELNAMAASNQIKQFSSSWGFYASPNQTTDEILQQMAAQGQSFFQASGDGDAWTSPIWQPADSTNLTVVGGTTLFMNGTGASYQSEKVWNAGDLGRAWGGNGSTNNYWGSGGGVSGSFTIPYWQTNVDMTTNLGSTTMRNIPDVALTADNIYVTHGSGAHDIFGGTSCAAPLWAGFMALVNQQSASVNNPSAGFVNPAIYALGGSTNYAACFHDTTAGDNTWPGSTNEYFAVPGYDLCTGWGTPAGTNLINALAGAPDPLVVASSADFVAKGAVGGPFNGSGPAFNLYNARAGSLGWTLINTSVWFTTSESSGTLAAGAATSVTVSITTAANTLSAGTYTATVLFSNQVTQMVQPRTLTLLVGQSLVQDGGFESGTFSYWTLAGDTISGGLIFDAVEDPMDSSAGYPNVAHSGNYGAFLGDTNLALLSQPLPTCPGQAYLLSFWLNNPAGGSGQQFLVNWNTNRPATNTILALMNPGTFTWTNLNFVLTAAGASTTIQFGAENPPSYFGLDDVSVTPIPPPSFSSVTLSTNGFAFTWNALQNVNYIVRYKTNLLQPNWLYFDGPLLAVTNTVTELDTNDFNGSSQRFYRVSVSP